MNELCWQGNSNLDIIRQRSQFINAVRQFFQQQQILEVQVPCIQSGANIDHGIDPLTVSDGSNTQYLISSPEHFLKRLLASHRIALGCITPCFRAAENGRLHNSEFTMAEWYQPNWDCIQLQNQVIALLQHVSGLASPVQRISYRQAFQRFANVDPLADNEATLRAILDPDMQQCCHSRQDLLDAILVSFVEAQLGANNTWCFLTDYPADQAAQAQTYQAADGYIYARRFELYWNGIELANGYQECTDSTIIRQVFENNNPQALPIDEKYLSALDAGLPPCSGVAVGLDRIFMLCHGITDIRQTLSFSWDQI